MGSHSRLYGIYDITRHLKLGEEEVRDEDHGHGVQQAQPRGEGPEEEGKEPPSRDLRDAGYPVGKVGLGIHFLQRKNTKGMQ